MSPSVTVLTPTTGRESLRRTIATVQGDPRTFQFLLWDDFREGSCVPHSNARTCSLQLPTGFGRQGDAPGSALRAVGLIAAATEWVTMADDDVWWDPSHLDHFQPMLADKRANWGYCLRRVWQGAETCLGVDRFESVGIRPGRKVPYEMVDGNCMIFRRELGVYASQLYRETRNYNDDRLMYRFLKEHAGPPFLVHAATVNQVCPERLVDFFREHCSKE